MIENEIIVDRIVWRLTGNWKQQVEKDVKWRKKVSKRRSLKKIRVCFFSSADALRFFHSRWFRMNEWWWEGEKRGEICFDLSHKKCFITWGEPIWEVKTSFKLIALASILSQEEKLKKIVEKFKFSRVWSSFGMIYLVIKSFTIFISFKHP